jgi:hypothetical protein
MTAPGEAINRNWRGRRTYFGGSRPRALTGDRRWRAPASPRCGGCARVAAELLGQVLKSTYGTTQERLDSSSTTHQGTGRSSGTAPRKIFYGDDAEAPET